MGTLAPGFRAPNGSSSHKIPPVFSPVCSWSSDSHEGPGWVWGTPSILATYPRDFLGLEGLQSLVVPLEVSLQKQE